ncbi:MAG: hypothetical protein R3F40_12230 [Candidatus Competibacteraceae bacterium]
MGGNRPQPGRRQDVFGVERGFVQRGQAGGPKIHPHLHAEDHLMLAQRALGDLQFLARRLSAVRGGLIDEHPHGVQVATDGFRRTRHDGPRQNALRGQPVPGTGPHGGAHLLVQGQDAVVRRDLDALEGQVAGVHRTEAPHPAIALGVAIGNRQGRQLREVLRQAPGRAPRLRRRQGSGRRQIVQRTVVAGHHRGEPG